MRPLIRATLEARVVQLVNLERSRRGLRPVEADELLADAARAHSADMAARRYLAHVSPEGGTVADRVTAAGYRWSRVGENIAWGQPDARAVMKDWLASRGHRANIHNPEFVHLGVGVAHDTRSRIVWTQNFAVPAG
ncbi:CAP domain-containing protein [Spirilliplanes yamanashiensis]|uniref:SCP domain-containing protein n=1 Tax=Spirilliplanes yamanashiensis TaxID=42233 RepID=A0A8J4DIG7_9ACTN|nr:CAP domain-containing protein [Spirilliplanes yamanashiensis]MDP9817276.1 uncharacterized protein YkwD [Spirilliplanes yamanashiensis]GIJ03072.1 hypothetical protein Sya03_24240 [Spirilliplanes yamanashiensis]